MSRNIKKTRYKVKGNKQKRQLILPPPMKDGEIIIDKIGILGMARSGIAAAKKAIKFGWEVLLSDSRPKESFSEVSIIDESKVFSKSQKKNSSNILDFEFGGHSDRLLEMDYLVVSPGIPLNIPILQKAREKNMLIMSEIEFAYRLTHPATKIIAVTGSNGKSTTASLIFHILKSQGFDVVLGGNIGNPFSSFLVEKKKDFIVLEISSFQLELIHDFKPDVSVILNITPDHLDRYGSFDEYALTKFNIFKNYALDDLDEILGLKILNFEDKTSFKIAKNEKPYSDMSFEYFSIYEHNRSVWEGDDNSHQNPQINAYLQKKSIYVNGKEIVSDIDRLHLKGPHNMQNILAALLAVSPFIEMSADNAKLLTALKTFRPLRHRLEPVATHKGVEYINDSKATNTDSVIKALESFDKPIHLILGGSDKGEDFSILLKHMSGRVKRLYLIGETAKKLNEIFCEHIECEIFTIFNEAIASTIKNAKTGEIVLLSPACASFDWFKNYENRGDIFKKSVRTLINKNNEIGGK